MESEYLQKIKGQHAFELSLLTSILNVEKYGSELRKDVLRRIRTDLILINFNSCQAQILLTAATKRVMFRRNLLNCKSRRAYVKQLELLTLYLRAPTENEINIYHSLKVCATFTTRSNDNRNTQIH